MSLVTTAQVRQHYPALTGDEVLLTTMIAQADGLMAGACGFPTADSGVHTLQSTTYTRYPVPLMDPRVVSLGVPIVSVTSAHVSVDWTYGSVDAVTLSDLVIDGSSLILKPNAGKAWSMSSRVNRCVVVGGYATTPPALVAITATAVRHLLHGRHTGPLLSSSAGGQSMSVAAATDLLPPEVVAALAPYTIWGSRVG